MVASSAEPDPPWQDANTTKQKTAKAMNIELNFFMLLVFKVYIIQVYDKNNKLFLKKNFKGFIFFALLNI
jgi:hypothetical protein